MGTDLRHFRQNNKLERGSETETATQPVSGARGGSFLGEGGRGSFVFFLCVCVCVIYYMIFYQYLLYICLSAGYNVALCACITMLFIDSSYLCMLHFFSVCECVRVCLYLYVLIRLAAAVCSECS